MKKRLRRWQRHCSGGLGDCGRYENHYGGLGGCEIHKGNLGIMRIGGSFGLYRLDVHSVPGWWGHPEVIEVKWKLPGLVEIIVAEKPALRLQ